MEQARSAEKQGSAGLPWAPSWLGAGGRDASRKKCKNVNGQHRWPRESCVGFRSLGGSFLEHNSSAGSGLESSSS